MSCLVLLLPSCCIFLVRDSDAASKASKFFGTNKDPNGATMLSEALIFMDGGPHNGSRNWQSIALALPLWPVTGLLQKSKLP